MSQAQTMTLDEKLATSNKTFTLLEAEDRDGYSRLIRSIPMPSYLAKIYKKK
ncbi:hypothetical protein [Treponema sp. R80B11-R83G3]